jgi:tungstate transport system ATP-binding protein
MLDDRWQPAAATEAERTARPPDTLISLEAVGVAFDATALLEDINFDIRTGPPTILLGPNGAGKTTLLKLAMGLIQPSAGRVVVATADGHTAPHMAFVFQKPVMLRRSASANVAFALGAAGRPVEASTIARLLEQAGLAALADRPARKLSGGEQQRLALARALARAPDILLLDEPTASLDPAATKAVEDIITRIAADGVKIVMATHDLGQARRLAGDIVFLAKGRLVEHAPAARFFQAPASETARRFLAGDLVI